MSPPTALPAPPAAAIDPVSLTTGPAGTLAIGVIGLVVVAGLVYWDAERIDVDAGSPVLWAGLVAGTSGAGVATALAVPDAPLPGVLVLVALGPLVYALEREDTVHGEAPADPTQLPSSTQTASVDDGRDSGDRERDAGSREHDIGDRRHDGAADEDTGVSNGEPTRGDAEH